MRKLTHSVPAPVTLQLTLGPSDLEYWLLTGQPLLVSREGDFYRGPNSLPAALLVNMVSKYITHKTQSHLFQCADTSSIWKRLAAAVCVTEKTSTKTVRQNSWINWDGRPSGYVENPGNWIFLWKQPTLAVWISAVIIYSMYLRLNYSTTLDLKFYTPKKCTKLDPITGNFKAS